MVDCGYLVMHSIILVSGVYSLYYDYHYVDLTKFSPKNDMKFYKGRLKFLTLWNMLLQVLFFSVAVLNDVAGTNEHYPKKGSTLRKIKDVIFASLAFPLSMFVGLTFWGLYIVDRELVLPKAIDPYFPTWLNHCMHTNIMLFILVELVTTFRQYPPRRVCISILSVFMLTYLIWIHVIHAYSGMWVYPVLDVLNLQMRMVFFASLLGLALVLYFLGVWLNRAVWGKELRQAVGSSAPRKQAKKQH